MPGLSHNTHMDSRQGADEMSSNYYPEYMTESDIAEFQRDIENWMDDMADPLHDVNMELTTIAGE